MNPEKLTKKQREEFGKQIEGSRFVRDFCCSCGEPIRVSFTNLFGDNYCIFCDGHIIKGRHYFCDIRHTKDYDAIDIDSGFDDTYYSDSTGKKINPNNFLNEI